MANYSITSPDQIIDIGTIKSGVNKIISSADGFIKASNVIKKASDECDENTLKLGSTDVQGIINDLAEQVKSCKKMTIDYANEILDIANTTYQRQYAEYQRYLAYLEEQKKKQGN